MTSGQTTMDERARTAFGQSLASEEWAVRANQLAWKARRSRLLAFQSQEVGCSDPAEHHRRDAEEYEAAHADWVARMADIINGNEAHHITHREGPKT